MRLLILTVVTMGGLALVMEFVLVDTARLAKETAQGSAQITFPGTSGLPWNVKPRPTFGSLPALSGKDEVRAGQLWRSQQRMGDPRARRAVLRAIVELESSYRLTARHALQRLDRVRGSKQPIKSERSR